MDGKKIGMKTENEKKLVRHEEDMQHINLQLSTAEIGSELHKRLLFRKRIKQTSIDQFRIRVNEEQKRTS